MGSVRTGRVVPFSWLALGIRAMLNLQIESIFAIISPNDTKLCLTKQIGAESSCGLGLVDAYSSEVLMPPFNPKASAVSG